MSDSEDNNETPNEGEVDDQAGDKVWEAFMAFDHEKMGNMSTGDLRSALEYLGENVNEEETFLMISTCDPENVGTI